VKVDDEKIRERVDNAIMSTCGGFVNGDPYSLSQAITAGVLAALEELGGQADKALVIPLPPRNEEGEDDGS